MHIIYDLHPNVVAFSAGMGCGGTEPGVDARKVGIQVGEEYIPPSHLFIPRQTHSVCVGWAEGPGEMPDTDAVITQVPGLCVAVKTADCIPVLLYDSRQKLVAAVHAGWRGTVGRVLCITLQEMRSQGEDVHAVIGPGISLRSFEVGDEVYESFLQAGFPMDYIACRYLSSSSKWHIDLKEANRWLLLLAGVKHIHVDATCTLLSPGYFYSARRDTINTGRNLNGILLKPDVYFRNSF